MTLGVQDVVISFKFYFISHKLATGIGFKFVSQLTNS